MGNLTLIERRVLYWSAVAWLVVLAVSIKELMPFAVLEVLVFLAPITFLYAILPLSFWALLIIVSHYPGLRILHFLPFSVHIFWGIMVNNCSILQQMFDGFSR